MRSGIFLAAVLAMLAGCAGIEEMSAQSAIEPLAKPAAYRPGTELHYQKNGSALTLVVKAVDGELYSFENSLGCRWVGDGWFMPAVSWEDCEGTSGSQTVKVTGEIWPLAVGKSVSYEISGSNSRGNTWTTTRHCRVSGAVSIEYDGGETDVFKVNCQDDFRAWVYYVAPDKESWVALSNTHKRRGTTDKWELVSVNH